VGPDLELDGGGLVGDIAGRDGAAVDDGERSRRRLEPEVDGVGLDKGLVDEGSGRAGVDHREAGDGGALGVDIDREDEKLFRVCGILYWVFWVFASRG